MGINYEPFWQTVGQKRSLFQRSIREEAMIKKEIGNRLREARQEAGLTQEEIAKKLHIDRSMISCYETGKALPSIPRLYKISKILNKEISFFLPAEDRFPD